MFYRILIRCDKKGKRPMKKVQPVLSPPASTEFQLCTMCISELVEHCLHEIHAYQLGETNDGRYCVELFRRAMGEHDPLAWEALQQCVHEMMVRWIRVHPLR